MSIHGNGPQLKPLMLMEKFLSTKCTGSKFSASQLSTHFVTFYNIFHVNVIYIGANMNIYLYSFIFLIRHEKKYLSRCILCLPPVYNDCRHDNKKINKMKRLFDFDTWDIE